MSDNMEFDGTITLLLDGDEELECAIIATFPANDKDIDSKDALIACHHTVEEICKIAGADTLGYLRLEDVTKIGEGSTCKGYCTACFDGRYPTEIPTKYTNKYDSKISENKKTESEKRN